MTKKTARGLAKKTAASNRAFARMSPARKRVAIAKDVLAAIAKRAIRPTNGVYLWAKGTKRSAFTGEPVDLLGDLPQLESLREHLPALPPCNVCAKGAVLLCTVMRRNKVTVADANDQDWNGGPLAESLGDIFTPAQLNLIENEFEHGWGSVMSLPRGSAARMKVIMQNIVDNKGTFVPIAK